MTTPLRAALIGTGKISEEHLKFLRRDARATPVGVCDLSPSLARYAATRFQAGESFTDYRTMLAQARPDVVHVLTPPHTHVGIVSDCLAAGAHVIVEKPAAPTVSEAEALWDRAEGAGKRLIENHNYRFNEPILRMLAAVEGGRIGEVREVEVRMCLGIRGKGGRYADENLPHPSHKLPAGVLHEFMTHLSYLVLAFMPGWDRASALWSNHGGGNLFTYDDVDALIVSGPAHARIRFACSQGPDCFSVTVRGTRGWLETDLFQPHVSVNVPRPGGQQLSPLANQVVRGAMFLRAGVGGFFNKVLQHTPYEGLGTFLDRSYGAIATGGAAPVTREQSLAAARLIEALLKGARAA
jgi:predicted dehydrogenase